MQVAAHLSRWLADSGLGAADLSRQVVDRFLAARRTGYTSSYSVAALVPILGYLRRVGAAPAFAPEPPVSAAEVSLQRFAGYLVAERAFDGAGRPGLLPLGRPVRRECLPRR